MGESAREIVMHDIKRELILKMLKKGQRMDERAFDEYRPISVQKDAIKTCEGSALAKIGKTQVLVGAKIDTAVPFSDRPKEGIFSVNSEFLPLASSSFEPGPPNDNSIELARVTDRGIRSAEIETENPITANFFLEEGKVLALYLDIYVLDHSGNLADAASLAAISALTCTKIPKYETGKLNRSDFNGRIELRNFPIATTLVKIDKYLLADPTRDEMLAADTKITIVTTHDGKIAAIQKGKGALSKSELLEAVDIAFKKGAELRRYII